MAKQISDVPRVTPAPAIPVNLFTARLNTLYGLYFFWLRWPSCVRPFQRAWMDSLSMRPTTSPLASRM
jgi:hypothetical protein